ncbi:MAG: hypothetical protein WCC60_06230, partial [Ilumatobacteraceae bacterium]
METRQRRHEVQQLTAGAEAEVEQFLTTLRHEQARFLETMAHAGALLGSGAGQLGNVMAIQQRLTRQFFDAQRSILT